MRLIGKGVSLIRVYKCIACCKSTHCRLLGLSFYLSHVHISGRNRLMTSVCLTKHTLLFRTNIISAQWLDTDNWNPSPCKTKTYVFYIVNIIGARASAMLNRQSPHVNSSPIIHGLFCQLWLIRLRDNVHWHRTNAFILLINKPKKTSYPFSYVIKCLGNYNISIICKAQNHQIHLMWRTCIKSNHLIPI